jgi:hypothetical protein
VLFGTSALLVKARTTSGDARLFRILNQIPTAVAAALTPLSHLFLPAGIIAIVVLTVVYAPCSGPAPRERVLKNHRASRPCLRREADRIWED